MVTSLVCVDKKVQEGVRFIRLTRLNWCENGSNARKLRVKVARIRGALDLRHERWLHPLVVNVIPVNVAEEGLVHDFLGIRRSTSKTLIRLSGEELLQNRHRIPRHVDRIQRLIGENSVVNLVFVFTSERRLLQKHLINQDAKCPPVNRTAVLFV